MIRNQQAQYSSDACAMVLVPPSTARTLSAKPIPPPKFKISTKDYKRTGTWKSISTVHVLHTYTENYSNRSISPTGFSIKEEAQKNIYNQPHTSAECSLPPRGLEYYNYSAIWNQQSQYGAEASAMVLVPPSPARTASTRPTSPPKPKKPSKDYKHTGTQ